MKKTALALLAAALLFPLIGCTLSLSLPTVTPGAPTFSITPTTEPVAIKTPTTEPTVTPEQWHEGRTQVLTFSFHNLDVPPSCLVDPGPQSQPTLTYKGQEVTAGVTIDTQENITDATGPHMVDALLVPARFVSIDKIKSVDWGKQILDVYRLCYTIPLPDPATHTMNHIVIATEWIDVEPVPAFVLPSNDVPEVILDQTQSNHAELIGITDQFVSWFQSSIGKQVLLLISAESSGDPPQNPKLQDIMRSLRAGKMPPTSDSFQSTSGPKIGVMFVPTPDQVPAGAE